MEGIGADALTAFRNCLSRRPCRSQTESTAEFPQ